MEYTKAVMGDLDELEQLEMLGFPQAEAATRQSFMERLGAFSNHFYLYKENGRIVCAINGMVSNKEKLCDEMYEDAGLHDESGSWQMIFGVVTHPDYRGRHLAPSLMQKVIEECRKDGRKGIVLTCKKELIGFYEKMGFVCEGVSESVHGDAVWYDMRNTLE